MFIQEIMAAIIAHEAAKLIRVIAISATFIHLGVSIFISLTSFCSRHFTSSRLWSPISTTSHLQKAITEEEINVCMNKPIKTYNTKPIAVFKKSDICELTIGNRHRQAVGVQIIGVKSKTYCSRFGTRINAPQILQRAVLVSQSIIFLNLKSENKSFQIRTNPQPLTG